MTSIRKVAQQLVGNLVTTMALPKTYENEAELRECNCPLLILHGDFVMSILPSFMVILAQSVFITQGSETKCLTGKVAKNYMTCIPALKW